jgi:hypothetical protein
VVFSALRAGSNASFFTVVDDENQASVRMDLGSMV